MKYRIIEQQAKKADSVAAWCRALGISRSGFYSYRARARTPEKIDPLQVHLRAEFESCGRCYGSRRLQVRLQAKGFQVGRYRLRKIMKKNGLRPVWKRKFIHTTDSRHNLPVADNLLARRFSPEAPDRAWATDITYIRTRSGWLYLAVVLDLFSRRIVGWAMDSHMKAELVCRALKMAITCRQPAPGLLVHSDRGSQYASQAYRDLIDQHALVQSMSRQGNCWDNAVMERFFLNLKMERVWQNDYANHGEAARDITDYIVGFYNSVRLHSTLGYLPPIHYEQQQAEKKPYELSEKT